MFGLKHKVTIEVPSKKVYDLLTSTSGLKKWWVKDSKGTPDKIGGEIEFGDKKTWYNKIRIVALEKEEKVVWTITESKGMTDDAKSWIGTEVVFNLQEKKLERLKGKTCTILRFNHTKWSEKIKSHKNYEDFLAECNWYWGMFLLSLKNVAEGKPGMAM